MEESWLTWKPFLAEYTKYWLRRNILAVMVQINYMYFILTNCLLHEQYLKKHIRNESKKWTALERLNPV